MAGSGGRHAGCGSHTGGGSHGAGRAEPAEAEQSLAAAAAPTSAATQPSSATAVQAPPAAAVQAPPAAAAAPPPKPAKRRRLLYATLPGCWGALIFACLSFTPSLLPRGGVLQGLVCGIDAAIGYGLGVLAASIWRAFADREARRPRPWAWRAFLATASVLLVAFFTLGQYWQHEIRDLMGVTDYNIPAVIALPFVAVVVFSVLLLIGRGLRALYRGSARLLDRWIGHRAAATVGWLLVAGLTYLVVSGLLLNGLVSLANQAFSVRNTLTPEGVHQPTTGLRSGGPGSLVPWDTLGRQGRKFTGLGPTADDIATLVHHPAKEPIRAYAGLDSASDAESRAALAVRDLDRAGGFQRKNLLVMTTTGSGWVDPACA